MWPVGQVVKTSDFHSGITSSILVPATKSMGPDTILNTYTMGNVILSIPQPPKNNFYYFRNWHTYYYSAKGNNNIITLFMAGLAQSVEQVEMYLYVILI